MNSVVFDPETADLDAMLKRLHLANTRRYWSRFCEQAEQEDWTPRRLLAVICAEEIAQRKSTRINREVRSAGFPFLKTIDDFDFSLQSTLRLALLGSYLGPELMSEGRSLVLYGKTGRGKTHLAVAIAYRAIQNGYNARFATAAELIADLSDSSRTGDFRRALAAYTQPHVLVVDEVGYLNYGPDAANVLFHVVNNRHTQGRPMVFTTNKSPLTEWGDVLHDHDLAAAIVDRVLERGRLILMDGPSYRTRHLEGLDPARLSDSHEPARISGIDRPEYPEPAPAWPSTSRLSRALQRRGCSAATGMAELIGRATSTLRCSWTIAGFPSRRPVFRRALP
jgi:DNA replication protein DnaC